MSNYTKATNFATKDSLPTGNALKIVSGTEIDTEFSNIETAVNTKANIASPTFTGTATTDSLVVAGASIAATVALAASAVQVDAVHTFTAGQRGEITALTDAASIATDLALSNNYSVTLAGNRTFANPTNVVAGQSGSIFITQDGTGSRTLAYGGYFKFVGGTAPVLSTAAASVDRIDYVVASATQIHAVVSLDVK
tara:strand:+ start:2934 stop:3521 length:588 start_codon:yes stop_codon:yes gene_type:complete